MPVPSRDHCGYQLSGGVIPILPYFLWTFICSVIVLYTLFKTVLGYILMLTYFREHHPKTHKVCIFRSLVKSWFNNINSILSAVSLL